MAKLIRWCLTIVCLLGAVACTVVAVRSHRIASQWSHQQHQPNLDEYWMLGVAEGRFAAVYVQARSPALVRPSTRQSTFKEFAPSDNALPAQTFANQLGFSWFVRRESVAGLTRVARGLMLPLWLFVLLFLTPPLFFWRSARKRRLAKLAEGLCPNCGYDVRANPDRCPECGQELQGTSQSAQKGGA